MKRHKRNSIKKERPETSSSFSKEAQEHDLAYYIHDRVELMHQVFLVLKHKDIKAIAPECVRRLTIENLQELCTEELLGISSKRLCAILDGAEPPSDTESSSGSECEQLETISLDSISSDEDILSQTSSKKKKKKHRRGSKSSKKRRSSTGGDRSRASRAGLTVLELLELQARARAIRAQLHQDQAHSQAALEPEAEESSDSSDGIEIKEERPEVVEISSDDEQKPDVRQLQKDINPANSESDKTKEANKNKEKKKKKDKSKDKSKSSKKHKQNDTEKTRKNGPASGDAEIKESETSTSANITKSPTKAVELPASQTTTKGVNDMIVTVPVKPTRKIKLNRNNVTISVANGNKTPSCNITTKPNKTDTTINLVEDKPQEKKIEVKNKEKVKKKVKRKDKRKSLEKEGSDHDEITLQLSESEKMDLLEDLDRKNYDIVSSSSEDSESSDSSSDDENVQDVQTNSSMESNKETSEVVQESAEETAKTESSDKGKSTNSIDQDKAKAVSESEGIVKESIDSITKDCIEETTLGCIDTETQKLNENVVEPNNENAIVIRNIEDIPLREDTVDQSEISDLGLDISVTNDGSESITVNSENEESVTDAITNVPIAEESKDGVYGDSNANLKSDGEISPAESSEVEAVDVQPEVVCISDEDAKKGKKKKKKKDKKSKQEKKSKKSKEDFREGADENFFKKSDEVTIVEEMELNETLCIDDVYEILELSDDSSCYEVEGTVLSKEPTAEEIEALSAKIDEIKREDVITDDQVIEYERDVEKTKDIETVKDADEDVDNLENVSWKDRYLGSTKVKKVLTTSNIFNALRKKNKELKKKIEASKMIENEQIEKEKEIENPNETVEENVDKTVEEGSIEHYNTLEGSTKYVDPVPEPKEPDDVNQNGETTVTGEMKKDAKQLLKMYKKLLKYNDMNKPKDPNKKKKKSKKKDRKEKEKVAS